MFKKGQVDIKDMLLTIVIAGILFVVGLLIFANVSNVTNQILDPDESTVVNESVTITVENIGNDNSTLLAQSGYITNSEIVRNATAPFTLLIRGQDYKIVVQEGASGVLTARGNFTLFNTTGQSTFNGSALAVTYSHNVKSAAQTSADNLENTVLDSFSLGVIALIVLAAVVILGVLFRLSSA